MSIIEILAMPFILIIAMMMTIIIPFFICLHIAADKISDIVYSVFIKNENFWIVVISLVLFILIMAFIH